MCTTSAGATGRARLRIESEKKGTALWTVCGGLLGLAYEESYAAYLFVEVEGGVLYGQLEAFM